MGGREGHTAEVGVSHNECMGAINPLLMLQLV